MNFIQKIFYMDVVITLCNQVIWRKIFEINYFLLVLIEPLVLIVNALRLSFIIQNDLQILVIMIKLFYKLITFTISFVNTVNISLLSSHIYVTANVHTIRWMYTLTETQVSVYTHLYKLYLNHYNIHDKAK